MEGEESGHGRNGRNRNVASRLPDLCAMVALSG
jgi:hypothetical protein